MDDAALPGLGGDAAEKVPGLLQPVGRVVSMAPWALLDLGGDAVEGVPGFQPAGRVGSMAPWPLLERFGWLLLGPAGNGGWRLKNVC